MQYPLPFQFFVVSKVIDSLVGRQDTHTLWHLKLLLAYYSHAHYRLASSHHGNSDPTGLLVNAEMCVKVKCRVEQSLDAWLTGEKLSN